VTISSPSQDNASSVALSVPGDANQKPSMWGSTPEASQVGHYVRFFPFGSIH